MVCACWIVAIVKALCFFGLCYGCKIMDFFFLRARLISCEWSGCLFFEWLLRIFLFVVLKKAYPNNVDSFLNDPRKFEMRSCTSKESVGSKNKNVENVHCQSPPYAKNAGIIRLAWYSYWGELKWWRILINKLRPMTTQTLPYLQFFRLWELRFESEEVRLRERCLTGELSSSSDCEKMFWCSIFQMRIVIRMRRVWFEGVIWSREFDYWQQEH